MFKFYFRFKDGFTITNRQGKTILQYACPKTDLINAVICRSAAGSFNSGSFLKLCVIFVNVK